MGDNILTNNDVNESRVGNEASDTDKYVGKNQNQLKTP